MVFPTLAREIVLDALLMAVWRRNPKQGVIIHSEQDSHFDSDEWNRFCSTNGLVPSVSRRGNCFDYAAVESFFSSLKKEKIRRYIFKPVDMREQKYSIISKCSITG